MSCKVLTLRDLHRSCYCLHKLFRGSKFVPLDLRIATSTIYPVKLDVAVNTRNGPIGPIKTPLDVTLPCILMVDIQTDIPSSAHLAHPVSPITDSFAPLLMSGACRAATSTCQSVL